MSDNEKDETVFVSMPPNREGIVREMAVADKSLSGCAELVTERYDLPVSASDISNWELDRSALEAAGHPNNRLWVLDHPRCEGKYYIEEVFV